MNEINEYKIKISVTANLPRELKLGKNYDLTVAEVECRTAKEIVNDDGTADKVFTLKISEMSEVGIINEKEIIKARKKGSQSQVLRLTLRDYWRLYAQNYDEFNDFYCAEMSKIIDKYKSEL